MTKQAARKPRAKAPKAEAWFAVDKEGLSQVVERRGKAFAVLELVSNAWDEDITTVTASLEVTGHGRATLVVEDDSPDGFKDLTHAYTLFAPSAKKGEAAKRGRFNLGEKTVLALCDTATIVSTTGGYAFGPEGRTALPDRREAGSRFEGVLRMTKREVEEACREVRTLIPPKGIATTFNGRPLDERIPVHEFSTFLQTVIQDEEGRLRPSERKATVRLYEPLDGEKASIYELGIPVVESGDRWHADVQQKVPLSLDRDNVPPAFLRRLRTAILNERFDLLRPEDAKATWVNEALADPKVTPDAVRAVVKARFGDKVVAQDPRDPEAVKVAVADGYAVVHGGSFTKPQWENVRAAEAVLPAGQVTPSHAQIELKADGKPSIPTDEWSDGQRRIAAYAADFALALIGVEVKVEIHRNHDASALAWYGSRKLALNLAHLGNRWFDQPDETQVDALLVHELAHERVHDHLSRAYYDECCRLAAVLKQAAQRGDAPVLAHYVGGHKDPILANA